MFPTIRTSTQARHELSGFQRQLNRPFDEVFQGWPGIAREGSGSLVGAWIPPVDVFKA